MKRMTLLLVVLAFAAPAAVCANEQASIPAPTPRSTAARSASPSEAAKPTAPATAAPATQVAAAGNRAHDRLMLDSTAITGNRELPKVMSIVPWKEAEAPQGPDRPMGSLIEEVLSPVDREEFQREVAYYRDLTTRKSATQSPTPGANQP